MSAPAMQCKDIPDTVFLAAIRATPAIPGGSWRMRWDVHERLEESLRRPVPTNLFLAKARRLITRGLMGGCPCGCRGDYHLPEECIEQNCCPDARR